MDKLLNAEVYAEALFQNKHPTNVLARRFQFWSLPLALLFDYFVVCFREYLYVSEFINLGVHKYEVNTGVYIYHYNCAYNIFKHFEQTPFRVGLKTNKYWRITS